MTALSRQQKRERVTVKGEEGQYIFKGESLLIIKIFWYIAGKQGEGGAGVSCQESARKKGREFKKGPLLAHRWRRRGGGIWRTQSGHPSEWEREEFQRKGRLMV